MSPLRKFISPVKAILFLLYPHFLFFSSKLAPPSQSSRMQASQPCPKALVLIFLLFPLLHASDHIRNQVGSRAQEGASDSERAYNMFSILLSTDDVQHLLGTAANPQIVFKDGSVMEKWIDGDPNSMENNNASEYIHHDDQYSDRISFDFFFGAFQDYEIATPTCTSSDASVAKPKVIEFENDQQEQSGSFSIVYDCQKHSNPSLLRNVTVSVVFPVVSGLSVLFSFRKSCGGGHHEYIEFGYYRDLENGAREESRVPFTRSTDPLTVAPHVLSTKLYLHLAPPATTQEFFHIAVKSSERNLEITPKGHVFGGVLTRAESFVIHVLYECHGQGRYQVFTNIPIHPFDSLNASWTKDCGGGFASGLSVGSEFWIRDDVVKEGVVSKVWETALLSSTSNVEVPTVNSSIRSKEFWLSNDGFALQVAAPVITVEKPGTLAVVAPRGYTRGSIYTTESSGLVPQGERVRCRLRLICKKKGKSVVAVTFPVKSFTNVEVSFIKECRAPRRYVHSGFLRTANSVMMVVSLSIMTALAYLGRVRYQKADSSGKGKPAPGYRPV